MDNLFIKRIRTSKGLTQKNTVENISLTQSSFSKFEKGFIELRYTNISRILNNLDINMNEYEFIKNNHEHTKKEIIINTFFTSPYNNYEKMQYIHCLCTDYLLIDRSPIIEDIQILCNSLPNVLLHNDFNLAKIETTHIWKRLNKNNELYWYDLLLINAILFIFPPENRDTIFSFFNRGLLKYKNFHKADVLKINSSLNMIVLLMEDDKMIRALKEIEVIIPFCRKQRDYISLSITYVRKGICLTKLNKGGLEWIKKGIEILEVMEEASVLNDVKNEIIHFLNGWNN